MAEFLIVILIVFIFYKYNKNVSDIKKRLDVLESKFKNQSCMSHQTINDEENYDSLSITNAHELLENQYNSLTYSSVSQSEEKKKTIAEPVENSASSLWWMWVQNNWIIAAGTTFLAFGLITACVYLAFYMSAGFRVSSLALIGVLSAIGGYKLKNHVKFSELSLWLIALGGSLILGACVGACYFESMRLITSPSLQIMTTLMVMFINMFLAYKSSFKLSAYFSFLNMVLLSYLIYAHFIVVPYHNYIFSAAFLCSLITAFDCSPVPPLLTLIWFTFFNYIWLHVFGKPAVPFLQIGCIALLSLVNLSRYYFHLYQDRNLLTHSRDRLILHIISWLTVGINLFPYQMGTFYISYLIAFISLCVLGLACFARRLKATNLFYCDYIVAQGLCAIAVMLWENHTHEDIFSLLVAQGMTSTFILRVMKEESWIFKSSVFVTLSLILIHIKLEYSLLIPLAFVFQSLSVRFNRLNGITSGHLFFWILLVLSHWTLEKEIPIFHHLMLLSLASAYMINLRKVSQNHTVSLIGCGLLVAQWIIKLFPADLTLFFFAHHLSFALTPFMALTFIGMDYNSLKFRKTYSALYIFHITISLYALFHPYSDLLPSLIMIGASYFLYEIHKKVSEKWKPFVYQLGLLTFASFLVLHAYLNIQIQSKIFSIVDYSLVIAILGIGMGYMWLKTSELKNGVLEGILGLCILTIFMEISYPWQPLAYAFLGLGMLKLKLPQRATWYRYFLLMTGCVLITGINKLYQSPNTSWYNQTEIPSVLGLLGLSAFALNNIASPSEKIRKNFIEGNILPVYFSAIIFLYARLDLALLSLVWIICASFLASAALYLKNKNLLNFSYGTIIICLVRISFFDLSQEVISIRAVVLTLVGLLLIGLHMLYKRFSSRLSL